VSLLHGDDPGQGKVGNRYSRKIGGVFGVAAAALVDPNPDVVQRVPSTAADGVENYTGSYAAAARRGQSAALLGACAAWARRGRAAISRLVQGRIDGRAVKRLAPFADKELLPAGFMRGGALPEPRADGADLVAAKRLRGR
jgi:hypothetical protein